MQKQGHVSYNYMYSCSSVVIHVSMYILSMSSVHQYWGSERDIELCDVSYDSMVSTVLSATSPMPFTVHCLCRRRGRC